MTAIDNHFHHRGLKSSRSSTSIIELLIGFFYTFFTSFPLLLYEFPFFEVDESYSYELDEYFDLLDSVIEVE
jgi:hypothetical protein